MTREELYSVWAPQGSTWTPWAKAVLFAQMTGDDLVATVTGDFDLPAIKFSQSMAIVLDLPGAMGVDVAVELAQLGYRPVPLYNAIPGLWEIVDVSSVARAIRTRTEELAAIQLPFNAPPAFLLDVNRRGGDVKGTPGKFDNRSICFPTDFPSAAFMCAQGITSALLLTLSDHEPEADLSHTLVRWQEAGLPILAASLAEGGKPRPITVTRPSRFRGLWYGWLAALGFRRSPLGGYGGLVPYPAQYGGAG